MEKLPLPPRDDFINHFSSMSISGLAFYYKVSNATISRWSRHFKVGKIASGKSFRSYVLSDRQREIIIGSLLGDGSLTKIHNRRESSHFVETHSLKQLEYLSWKQRELSPISRPIKYHRNEAYFTTFSTESLTHFEQQWYLRYADGTYQFDEFGRRIKIVPDNFELTPLSLAIWYLDDGTNKKQKSCLKLCTHGFRQCDCELLIEKLKRLNISNCSVRFDNKPRKTYPYIYVGYPSCVDFLNMIKEQVPCSDIAYKLDTTEMGQQNLIRKQKGICTRCGVRCPLENKTKCLYCTDVANNERQQLRMMNLCRDCRKPSIVGRVRCESCLEKDRLRHRKLH